MGSLLPTCYSVSYVMPESTDLLSLAVHKLVTHLTIHDHDVSWYVLSTHPPLGFIMYCFNQKCLLTLYIKWHWPIPMADWCHTAFWGLNKRFLYLSFYFCLCLQTPFSFMYEWGPLSSMDGTLCWEILPLSQVCLSTVLSLLCGVCDVPCWKYVVQSV